MKNLEPKIKGPGILPSAFDTFRKIRRQHGGDLRAVKAILKMALVMTELEEDGIELLDNRKLPRKGRK